MAEPIISKTCTKCKQVKALSEFPKDRVRKDGLYPYCRICQYRITRAYYNTPRGKIIKKRYQQSEIYKTRKKAYRASTQGKAADNRYRQSEHGKTILHRRDRKYYYKHPYERKARSALAHAIRDGKLQPAKKFKCRQCPAKAKQYHHWHGYAPEHWLDVIPLCMPCHKVADSKLA